MVKDDQNSGSSRENNPGTLALLPATAKQGEVVPRDEMAETTVISETLLTRRIHFRR